MWDLFQFSVLTLYIWQSNLDSVRNEKADLLQAACTLFVQNLVNHFVYTISLCNRAYFPSFSGYLQMSVLGYVSRLESSRMNWNIRSMSTHLYEVALCSYRVKDCSRNFIWLLLL